MACKCVCVSLRSIVGLHFNGNLSRGRNLECKQTGFTLLKIESWHFFHAYCGCLSKMVVKCIVWVTFQKSHLYIFLLLLLSINTKLAYVFTTILPPFWSCYLASVCHICCCFESRKRLTVELYTVLLLLLLVSALLYNGFLFSFMFMFMMFLQRSYTVKLVCCFFDGTEFELCYNLFSSPPHLLNLLRFACFHI